MNTVFVKLKEIGSDVDGALARFMGDEELYIECLESFTEDENIPKLERLIRTTEYQEMFNCAHTIKGVAANLGLTSLFNTTCILVEELRNSSYDNIETDFEAMSNEFNIFVSIMHN